MGEEEEGERIASSPPFRKESVCGCDHAERRKGGPNYEKERRDSRAPHSAGKKKGGERKRPPLQDDLSFWEEKKSVRKNAP